MPIIRRVLLFPALLLVLFVLVELSYKEPEVENSALKPGSRKVLSSKPKNDLEEMLEKQKERKQRLRSTCLEAYGPLRGIQRKGLNVSSLDHVISVDQHRLLYCYIPKVACTNWKRTLMVLTGKANTSDPLSILADDSHRPQVWHTLVNFTTGEALSRLKNYDKFMFVRHPFERLVSAYINKFAQNYSEYFRTRYGRTIVKTYRKNPSEESLARGHDVTFSEFVEYLIDPKTREKGPFNEHWRPMHELCRPCHIKYDIIGKYETLLEDASLVLERMGVSHLVSFPKIVKSGRTDLMKSYINQLTKDQIWKLYRLFELDFRLFGYSFEYEK